MAKYRNPDETELSVSPPSTYNIGNKPPLINWTVVAGDSASFRIYVEDDLENAIEVDEWTIRAQFRRYSDDIGDDFDFVFLIREDRGCATDFADHTQNRLPRKGHQSVHMGNHISKSIFEARGNF